MARLATGDDYNRKVECSAKALKINQEVILWNQTDDKTYVYKVLVVRPVGSQIFIQFEHGAVTVTKKRTFFVVKGV